MPSEMEKMKQIIGNLLNEFGSIIHGTATQLNQLGNAVKEAQFKLLEVQIPDEYPESKITLKKPTLPKELKKETESLEKVKEEVPKLLNQLKMVMGTDLEQNFDLLTSEQRKKALKDMADAIEVLTQEYQKFTGSSEEE